MTTDAKSLQLSRTHQAARNRRTAIKATRWVDGNGEPTPEASAISAECHAQADDLLQLRQQVVIANGEAVNPEPDTTSRAAIADTLAKPTQVSVDASIARTDLLVQVQSDVLALGVDAAHSIQAENSLEKMLAHQLALLHSVVMRTMDKALSAKEPDRVGMLNSTTRMMDVFQRGLLTINRLRSGGSQTVTVRHVTVQAGAQAVIGNVRAGRGNGHEAKRRPGKSKNGH